MSTDGPRGDPEGCGGNAAPYVLGALTEEEHLAFRRHMQSCVVCRVEVAALALVAAALPASAPQVSAPPELKRRVMSSVHQDARQRRSVDSPKLARRGGFAWLRWRPALAAGALAAAVIVLAAIAIGSGGGGGAGTRVIRAEVLAPRARASVNVTGGHAQLTIAGMPQPGPGHVYQMWIKRSGGPLPTNVLFTVASDGGATVGVPGSLKGVKEVMVTSEPTGGSRMPTSPAVIVARLS
jgi:anti-sigma-K factor RskA